MRAVLSIKICRKSKSMSLVRLWLFRGWVALLLTGWVVHLLYRASSSKVDVLVRRNSFYLLFFYGITREGTIYDRK